MKFCDKLAKQRKNNNLSQEQLADKLGVSRQAVSKWESGNSYPDMEKLIQMCKFLNCTLEDLMDDGTINGNSGKEQKINFNKCLQEFLDFITKTANMFGSMKGKEKIKCIFEMFIIFLILILILGTACVVLYSVIQPLVELLPYFIGKILNNILLSIISIVLIVIGVVIFIHLFKIRYLDYFITIEDQEVSEKIIEEPVDKNKNSIVEEKREKIIIRDPKHSSFSFLNILGKIILFMIKFLVAIFSIPIILLFLLFVFMSVISLYHTMYGIIFLFIGLSFIAIALLSYIVIHFIYNFIFNRKINLKFMFIIFIISLIMLASSIGLSCMNALNYKYVDDTKGLKTATTTEYVDVGKNTHFTFHNSVEYVIDNSLDKAKVEITTLKDFSYYLQNESVKDYYGNNEDLDNYYLYANYDTFNFHHAYKLIINDLKKNIIRNYNYDNFVKIKVTLNEEDYYYLLHSHNQN